ncbi:IS110 family transposase [Dyadobacter crusticola]|uniref:IS110 family transposase n=1 Tax=Dyadobacter crusticola TaxID=292407 RepID=UPI0004E107A0|nr:IS110 family transposase [Dyadobacter crusticola]
MSVKYFFGVDISKLTVDIALIEVDGRISTFKIENSQEAIKKFLAERKREHGFKFREAFFCAENMGIYGDFLTKVLSAKKIAICLESALQIKKSLGIQRGKNDRLDAVRIAEYAKKNHTSLKIWNQPRECIEQLKKLTTIRKRLIKVRAILINEEKVSVYFLNSEVNKSLNSCYANTLDAINKDIEAIESKIDSVISGDQRLSNLTSIITSVPCVGKVIATQILTSTNEFLNISSAKQFASYCGVAPFEWSSGSSLNRRRRVSFFANKELKTNLHLAAMISISRSNNNSLKDYYQRKQKEGKNNMSILNAIRNKIIHRIFACVRDNKHFLRL